MEKDIKNFTLGLSITLGTIVIGLVSYILYTEDVFQPVEATKCEYGGWAYLDKEIFDSKDGCNICFCHSGEIVCTQNSCEENSCEYQGNTYSVGQKFQIECNTCICGTEGVTCTTQECN